MSILVTGGAGFVGTNLAEQLIEKVPEEQIIVLDALLYPMGERNFPEKVRQHAKFRVVKGSVTDKALLATLIEEGDTIIHMAVETGILDKFIEVQLGGTKGLLDLAVEKKARRVIFQSTCDIYGHNNSDDILETDPPCATHMYSATKLGAEGLMTAYHYTYGLPIVILRPVSIYGPRQYPGWLVARFINLALAGQTMPILGTGDVYRDWIHVADICRGLIAAIDAPVAGEIINLGTGTEQSVIDIARKILALAEKPESLLTFNPERPGDFKRQITHAKKARKLMGWSAQIAFDDGLRQTFEWYRDHADWVSEQMGKDADRLGFRVTEKV